MIERVRSGRMRELRNVFRIDKNNKYISMDLLFLFKIIFFLGMLVALYAVIRNLDIIKIILYYWFDLLFRK